MRQKTDALKREHINSWSKDHAQNAVAARERILREVDDVIALPVSQRVALEWLEALVGGVESRIVRLKSDLGEEGN